MYSSTSPQNFMRLMADIQTRPAACKSIVPATAHWPIVVARNSCICSGLPRQTKTAMKYVSKNTTIVETSDWAELERIRRAISMRSRIVRPTLAKVGARLPPVSACTERAEANSRKVSSGHALRQSVIDRPRIVSITNPPHDFFKLRKQRAARFAHGVLQGVGDAGPGPQRGHHQVDGVGQLGFDFCGPPPRQIGLQARRPAGRRSARPRPRRAPASRRRSTEIRP